MATRSVGREIWYADNNGFIAGSKESVDEVTSTIIDTYNEHFGTRISHLTPEAKTFNVGDIIKNWNAYEKIEMPELKKIAVWLGSGYVIGQVNGNKYMLSTNENNNDAAYMVGETGIVYSEQVRSDSFDNYIISRIQTEYPSVNQIVNDSTKSYQAGETVEDWSEYEKIR